MNTPRRLAALLAILTIPLMAQAQNSAFEAGWRLLPDASVLNFQSIKNGSKVETSSFATLTGGISETGQATIKVLLDSVDTKVDLRNVRMRFLFFESFTYPEATITAQLSEQMLADLPTVRRKTMEVPYTINLHGVTQERADNLTVTLIGQDLVSVATAEPITLAVADFNLAEGIAKLEAAANVQIVPSTSVTFEFLFERAVAGGTNVTASQQNDAAQPAAESVVSVALEPTGNFDEGACKGRFEILSRAGNIYFSTASARLNAESNALLDQLLDIVKRCPDMTIEVQGHTDSDGSDQTNQILSEKRAASVVNYLTARGVSGNRLRPRGMGEAVPVAPNNSAANKRLNRRIEFVVVDG